jgi:hypothetical protein
MLGPFIIAAPTALETERVREISPQDQNQLCAGRYITQFQGKRSREVYSPDARCSKPGDSRDLQAPRNIGAVWG